jgi:L-threonylcarbamoyladenylate synthase
MIMDEKIIRRVVDAIQHGKLIVYPTDTLYGLGASIFKIDAITSIFQIKQRPFSLPLPIAVSNIHMLSQYVQLNSLIQKFADHFLPGKLTLICRKKPEISNLITSDNETVAIRIPNDQIALKIINKTGPLIATSANIHGQLTPKSISEIRKLFKPEDIEVYIDDGSRSGAPSTIVDVTGSRPQIIREGSISKERIRSFE